MEPFCSLIKLLNRLMPECFSAITISDARVCVCVYVISLHDLVKEATIIVYSPYTNQVELNIHPT